MRLPRERVPRPVSAQRLPRDRAHHKNAHPPPPSAHPALPRTRPADSATPVPPTPAPTPAPAACTQRQPRAYPLSSLSPATLEPNSSNLPDHRLHKRPAVERQNIFHLLAQAHILYPPGQL